MTSVQAILTGAALVAVTIFAIATMRPAMAQHMSGGPFMIVHNGNPNANSSIFRLDQSTGEVTYCFVNQSSSSTSLVCTPPVK